MTTRITVFAQASTTMNEAPKKFLIPEGLDLDSFLNSEKVKSSWRFFEKDSFDMSKLEVYSRSCEASSSQDKVESWKSHFLKDQEFLVLNVKIQGNAAGDAAMFEALIEKLVRVEDRSSEDLLKSYDVDKASIVGELRRRGQGHPFIVYNASGAVHVAKSLEILREIQRGQTSSSEIDIDGKLCPVYRPGELPVAYADVCPITGEFLLSDYCSRISRSWSKFEWEAREIILIQIRYIDGIRPQDITDDQIRSYVGPIFGTEGDIKKLRALFPKAGLQLDAFRDNGQAVNGLRRPLPKGRTAAHEANLGGTAPLIRKADAKSVEVVECDDDDAIVL